MSRIIRSLGLALTLTGATFSAQAADYFDDFGSYDGLRGSYGDDWQAESPLQMDAGIRYWYSMGQHDMSVGGGNYTASDTAHILEGFLKIDDTSTFTYLKGQAGYAAIIDGTYQTPGSGGVQTMSGGEIGYAGADLGYQPFGNDMFRVGGLLGYQYSTDNPDMGRENYVNASGGGNSEVNSFEIHALRLGASAHAEFADMVEIDVEAAAIPYASLYGTYGAYYQAPFPGFVQGSAGTIEGNMFGAAGEIMLGVKPTENLTLQLGGRAQYMTGDATMSYSVRPGGGGAGVDVIRNTTNLEFMRYGLVGGIAGSF